MVVKVVGRALEFGNQPNSLTEMFMYTTGAPVFTSPVAVEILSSGSRPAPREATVDSFSVGTSPRPSRGEKYEGMYVIVRNVTVNSVDLGSGRFTFVDANGNQMLMYDGSGYYTLRGHRYTNSRYSPPPVGTKLEYIRGVILPQPRTGTGGEYAIMPMYPGPNELQGSSYPGDIKIDKFAPQITNLRRTPGVPTSSNAVSVTFAAANLNSGAAIDSAALYYRVGLSGSYVQQILTLAPSDTLYRATIPASPNDSIVSYYTAAYGSDGTSGTFPDATVPFFYKVRDAGLRIFDVQFTPFVNGQSGFVGDTVTVSGVITADTSDYVEISGGRPRIFMATQSGAWNGVAIWGSTASVGVDTLQRGDSLQVTGIVSEANGRTNIQVLSKVFRQRGVTVPAPSSISISGSGSVSYDLSNPPVNGNLTFEQWEGSLVQITNPYVVRRNADNPNDGSGSNFGEYFISANAFGASFSNFGLRVNDNGTNRYYADTSASYTAKPSNAVLIPLGSRISTIRGILDYSFSFYKLEPRKDDDFGTITGVEIVDLTPSGFDLSQNYPNPFNPATQIRYSVPTAGKVTLKIYNLLGQVVATLVNQEQVAGTYVTRFDASRLASGVYFYRLQTDGYAAVKKMMFLK
ncbi:MAG: T9SS type A sorting domain-containing protein [Ignavibacteriales bacterium]|nr:T9SS type A sorting domain-containing protein [Ignavibacteriales bacterium]